MWFLFGLIAIAATCVNLYLYVKGKEYKFAMAAGLSFTALTAVADYSMVADWVRAEDWSALSDVVPIMSTTLWVLTVISIFLNISPMLLEIKSKK
ncbi:hypothetical protein [Planococcus sp. SSTMD024]|uniref:hypothetical protein n=1 Tax=Planococcus sp. SSTMD024 TaxID=3242163 RepID=UPI00351E9FDD